MNIARVNELKQAFDDENVSWGEIAEIEGTAKGLGIKHTEEMQVIDVLLEIEEALLKMNRITIIQGVGYWIVKWSDNKGKKRENTFDSFESVSRFVKEKISE